MNANKLRNRRNQPRKFEGVKRPLRLILVVIILITLGVIAGSRLNRPAERLASETTLTLGATIYAENCASCHGETGEGHGDVVTAPALNEREHAWHHADGQLQQIVLNGGQTMPPFKDQLSNEEVIAVIRYFQTWWTASQLQSQQSISAQLPFQE